MGTVNKKEMLAQLRAGILAQLKEVTDLYQQEHSEVLLTRAADGGWSIAQCLEHLNTYAAWYHPQIRKELSRLPAGPSPIDFTSTRIGRQFIRIMKVQPGGRNYKTIKRHMPALKLNAHSVVALFIYNQQEMLKYLDKAEDADLDLIRIPTSIIKWIKLKLGDVLQFLVVHNERHLVQARNNYRSQMITTTML